jgi:ubiquitin-protein ligase
MAPTAANMMQMKQKQLKSRKLRDIQELVEKPYPGIKLFIKDDNINTACLILSPEGQRSLHLRVAFPDDYPLTPPGVTIQSNVVHPNVFNEYICATILNDDEAYTSAYTLKSICMQLLSFFSDDRIESAHGGGMIDVKQYREDIREDSRRFGLHDLDNLHVKRGFKCDICRFGHSNSADSSAMTAVEAQETLAQLDNGLATCPIADLPFELLLMISDELDTDELAVASKAWSRFGATLHQLIPTRNLQCFTIKKGTKDVNIGVGVMVERGNISCEFDYVSDVAFVALGVRKSIHGLDFRYWMPLALNERHWARVKGQKLNNSLGKIQEELRKNGPLVNVLYAFSKFYHNSNYFSKGGHDAN